MRCAIIAFGFLSARDGWAHRSNLANYLTKGARVSIHFEIASLSSWV